MHRYNVGDCYSKSLLRFEQTTVESRHECTYYLKEAEMKIAVIFSLLKVKVLGIVLKCSFVQYS